MKISKMTPMVLGTPWRNLSYIKVETDEGLVGWGECRSVARTESLIAYLQSRGTHYALGTDPFDIESLVHRMYYHDYARMNDVVGSAAAMIEIACWDIMGKALNKPVYKLLGGKCHEKLKAYANGWYTVERKPEEFHKAAKNVVARGYRALKVDPFGAGFYEMERKEKRLAVSLIEAIRDAVGPDCEIMLEMHGRFSPATAIDICSMMEEFDPAWVEEPVPPDNFEALARVSEKVNIPVATGERCHTRYESFDLLRRGKIDILQTDITHTCGILEGKKIAAMADAQYVTFAPHNVGGPISTAANLHLAASTTNFKIQEHFNDFVDEWVKQAATGPGYPPVVDGYFAIPEGPGLGVTVNEDFIKEHPATVAIFNLFEKDWHRRQK
jgi:galactonate dehydratase